jgi:hypothetical protein
MGWAEKSCWAVAVFIAAKMNLCALSGNESLSKLINAMLDFYSPHFSVFFSNFGAIPRP